MIINKMDHLTRDALAAAADGMTYGKWKALHPHTEYPDPPQQKNHTHKQQQVATSREVACAWCGKKFYTVGRSSREYCDDVCKKKAAEKRYLELHPPKYKVCVVCGKEISLSRAGSRYCGNDCKVTAYRRRKAGVMADG